MVRHILVLSHHLFNNGMHHDIINIINKKIIRYHDIVYHYNIYRLNVITFHILKILARDYKQDHELRTLLKSYMILNY